MDWLFGVAWVTDRHLVTCSRDKSVKLWEVAEGGPAVNETPLHTALLHKARLTHVMPSILLSLQPFPSQSLRGALDTCSSKVIANLHITRCVACCPEPG